MARTKEADQRAQNADGVALSIDDTEDRYAKAGVAVAVPEDVSTPESKSGQKADPKKEND